MPVSVVMPAKNAALHIAEAISSVLAQGDEVGELIVVDDGSSDQTTGVVRQFDDPKVRLLMSDGNGVSAARNTGARAAAGEWLMFLDADDRLRPGALATLTRAAMLNPQAVLLYGNYDRIDIDGRHIGRRHLLWRRRAKPSGQVLERLIAQNFIVNGGLLIVRSSAFAAVGGFDESLRYCEDWHCWCRLASLGPFAFVPEFLLEYRVHKTNTMNAEVRSLSDFLPAADRVFADRRIVNKLSARAVPTLRRAAEVHLITYLAAQAIRVRRYQRALSCALMAMQRSPGATPKVILRLAAAFVGV